MIAVDSIYLQGLEFYAYHGVMAEEKSLGQRFVIDLVLELELRPAGISDDLTKSVSYAEVYSDIREIVTGSKFNLLEALAEKIATTVLFKYPVHQVTVKIRKPQAPIPGVFEYMAVEITRQKQV